jgi:hypothetical protein
MNILLLGQAIIYFIQVIERKAVSLAIETSWYPLEDEMDGFNPFKAGFEDIHGFNMAFGFKQVKEGNEFDPSDVGGWVAQYV